MTEKSSFKLILYAALIAVLLLGLVNVIALAGGKAFYLEFIGLLFLLVLTVIGFVGYARRWGETILFFVFLCYLLNLVLVWYFLGAFYLTLSLLVVIGMLVSFPKKPQKRSRLASSAVHSSEPHSEVFDAPKTEASKTEMKPELKVEKTSVAAKSVSSKPATIYSPGKLVASKASNLYHEPKCEWAKKIIRHRRVWFNSKEEAWEKGYRAHSCIR